MADLSAWAIPLGALIVSLSTLVFGAIILKGKTGNNHTESLDRRLERQETRNMQQEERIENLEVDLATCEREKIRYMEMLVHRGDEHEHLGAGS